MEKDRDLRYRHASDLHADLSRLKRDTSSGRSEAVASSPPVAAGIGVPGHAGSEEPWSDTLLIGGFLKRHSKAAMGAALLLVVGLVALAWFLVRRSPAQSAELTQKRLTFNASGNPVGSSAISPDGKYVA